MSALSLDHPSGTVIPQLLNSAGCNWPLTGLQGVAESGQDAPGLEKLKHIQLKNENYATSKAVPLLLAVFAAKADQDGDFTYSTDGVTVTITRYTGTGGAVAIPATIGGLPVVSIAINAFFNCTTLTNVDIPAGITSIGLSAFYGCSALTNLTIPDSVTSLGELSLLQLQRVAQSHHGFRGRQHWGFRVCRLLQTGQHLNRFGRHQYWGLCVPILLESG